MTVFFIDCKVAGTKFPTTVQRLLAQTHDLTAPPRIGETVRSRDCYWRVTDVLWELSDRHAPRVHVELTPVSPDAV